MKKVLLFSIIFLLTLISVNAYETIIIKYPAGEVWTKAYYKKAGDQAILMYVPNDQSFEHWKRAIIIHSYYQSAYPINVFIGNEIARMTKNNPTGKYRYLKLAPTDSMAVRCTEDYKNVKAQCEFYRVTNAHDGIISLHYINRDEDDFKKHYTQWYDIIKNAKYYNSYYRDERILNKAEYFELW